MPTIVIRDLSGEAHRAVQRGVAQHGRTVAAEARSILDAAVRPAVRVKLGSALAAFDTSRGNIAGEPAVC